MAIVPSTKYTGQIDTSDLDAYPHGKAKNVVTAGDGSGTPLEKDWVNDLWGFLQSLLDIASITPSGDPDEVGASDYLDAMEARYRTLHPLIAANLVNTNTSPFGTDVFGARIVWEPTQEKFYASISENTSQDWLAYESTDGVTWSGGTAINLSDDFSAGPAQIAYCQANAKIGAFSESGFHLSSSGSTAGFSTTPTGTASNLAAGTTGLVWDNTNGLWIACGTLSGTNGYIYTSPAAGTTWTQRDTEATSTAVSMANDRAGQTVVVYSGTDLMHYSSNGTTWTPQSTGMSKTFTRVWWCQFASVFVAWNSTSNTMYWSADGADWVLCPFPAHDNVIVCEDFLLFIDQANNEMYYAGSVGAIKGDAPFINLGFEAVSNELSPTGNMRGWQGSGFAFSYISNTSAEYLVSCTFGLSG